MRIPLRVVTAWKPMGPVRTASFVVWGLAFLPVTAWAQSSVTGVVRDTSGGVLPGVTVEAASPALIEKVRSVVTDPQGRRRPRRRRTPRRF
jgi:hypothetical protein